MLGIWFHVSFWRFNLGSIRILFTSKIYGHSFRIIILSYGMFISIIILFYLNIIILLYVIIILSYGMFILIIILFYLNTILFLKLHYLVICLLSYGKFIIIILVICSYINHYLIIILFSTHYPMVCL
jgi:hypothetical protein